MLQSIHYVKGGLYCSYTAFDEKALKRDSLTEIEGDFCYLSIDSFFQWLWAHCLTCVLLPGVTVVLPPGVPCVLLPKVSGELLPGVQVYSYLDYLFFPRGSLWQLLPGVPGVLHEQLLRYLVLVLLLAMPEIYTCTCSSFPPFFKIT